MAALGSTYTGLVFPAGMSSVKIECVANEGYRIGESPVWDEKEGALVFVDITGRKVCRWSPGTQQVRAVAVGKERLGEPSAERERGAFRAGTAGAGREPVGGAGWRSSTGAERPLPKTWSC